MIIKEQKTSSVSIDTHNQHHSFCHDNFEFFVYICCVHTFHRNTREEETKEMSDMVKEKQLFLMVKPTRVCMKMASDMALVSTGK